MMRKDIPSDLPIYQSRPPEWLPPAHTSSDLGYPGFYPPRPGKDEDVISVASVKNGFILGQTVSAESFSAQTMSEGLRSGPMLSTLEELMNEVFNRRRNLVPSIPPSTFRIPSRVTLNDSRRHSWFADLANPDVPLHKLGGKNVPHGAKGHDLLDLLHSNNVAIARAVWFLRVFGANETAGLRNKPSYNPTQYSVEWVNVVTGYLKKQLAEITVPSAPRLGLNIKQTFKGVFADPESRNKWISRFSYCLELLRSFYTEGMVDKRGYLVWLVQQIVACNLGQLGFVARLVDEYLEDMVDHRALMRPLVESCLSKLSEIRSSSLLHNLADTQDLLVILLQRVLLSLPDAFVSPAMWNSFGGVMESIVLEACHPLDPSYRAIQTTLRGNLEDVRRRNEAMLFKTFPPLVSLTVGAAVGDIELLNSISAETTMDTLVYFSNDKMSFPAKLEVLLTWSVTPLAFGNHRPLAAVTIIRYWRDRESDRASRRDDPPPCALLHDHIFQWLDQSDTAGDGRNLKMVALLFDLLVKYEIFSYSGYIQRLVARGEGGQEGLMTTGNAESRHRNFLRWIPLLDSSPALVNLRRATLYGTRVRVAPEESHEKTIRAEMRGILPVLSGGIEMRRFSSISGLLQECKTLSEATRFEQTRIFKLWLLPLLVKLSSGAEDNAGLVNAYCITAELLSHTMCYGILLELSLSLLSACSTADLLRAIVDTLNRFSVFWNCMDMTRDLSLRLFSAHQSLKGRGFPSRALLSLILKLDRGCHLDEMSRSQLLGDITAYTLALQPHVGHPDEVPSVLPEILLLAADPDPNAPSLLANSLWIKYRMSLDWAWKVWDNAFASLRQVPSLSSEPADRQAGARQYSTFLWHIDQHLPSGLDDPVLRWFRSTGLNEVSVLTVDAWEIVIPVLLHLCIGGALKVTTLLNGLVYPAWKLAAHVTNSEQFQSQDTLLFNLNQLVTRLFSCQSSDILPFADMFDEQNLEARRQEVYLVDNFPGLIAAMPLLVTMENNPHISPKHREQVEAVRLTICSSHSFRQAVFRNLEVTRQAFEDQVVHSGDIQKPMMTSLKLVLGEQSDDWHFPDSTSFLSPWKLPALTLELRFVLRQAESVSDAANPLLEKFISMLFQPRLSSEEGYIIAEITKGAGLTVPAAFINRGLEYARTAIADLATSESETFPANLRHCGELLRVLIFIAKPLRDDYAHLTLLQPEIQDELVRTLSMHLQNLSGHVQAASQVQEDTIIILARFLQFVCSLRLNTDERSNDSSTNIIGALFRIAMRFGEDKEGLYSLLIDTLYFVLDVVPADIKGVFDPFRFYPTGPISNLPSDLSPRRKAHVLSLLPDLSPCPAVRDLSVSHRDQAGRLIIDGPVKNRPWEWIENLGEQAPPEVDGVFTKPSSVVKNSGSLSLENFAAQMTGEAIIHPPTDEKEGQITSNIRTFEDRVSADSLFSRDWRETRVDLNVSIPIDVNADPVMSGDQNDPPIQQLRSQTATPSNLSGSVKSFRQSPGISTIFSRNSSSTVSDAMDGDRIPSASTSSGRQLPMKRKAPPSEDSMTNSPVQDKKGKTKASQQKGRPKKR